MRQKNKKAALDEITRQVMASLKAKCPQGYEVHHAFGRVGRLAACRYFCVYARKPKGGASHHDLPEAIQQFRDDGREAFLLYGLANRQNRDQTTCWYSECEYRTICPLYEEGP